MDKSRQRIKEKIIKKEREREKEKWSMRGREREREKEKDGEWRDQGKAPAVELSSNTGTEVSC